MEEKLGKRITPEELAMFLGVNVKTVRQYYRELGGIRLGSRYIFLKKELFMPYQKNGKWKAQVRKDGKRKEKTFNTKKEAIAWESQMRQSEEEWQEKTATISLIDWAEAYLDSCQERFVKKTYDEKRATFKRLFKEIDSETPVVDLTAGTVQSYLLSQKKERSGYASNKDRKNLLAGWNWGILYMNPRLPKENPFLTPKMPEERSPRYVPPEDDFWKVLDIAKGQDRVMLLAFLHLACRRGEAFRLKWDDVDFEKKRIRLWTRKRENGSFEYEWLPMTQELQRWLRWWMRACPVKSDNVFICLEKKPFCAEYYGGPFKERRHFMKSICDKAKVKPFGFHAIRHLSASALYHLGYSVSTIQTILRHKSPNTTERYLKSLGLESVRKPLEDLSRGRERSPEKEDSAQYIFGGLK